MDARGRARIHTDLAVNYLEIRNLGVALEEAGIARKVDFGEGRFRFEHSYRHPRHFHLICKTCNRSFEFLSSDVESLVEEVAAARGISGSGRC